ncbi:unnamed protein product, partial [Owenia fusiformis]
MSTQSQEMQECNMKAIIVRELGKPEALKLERTEVPKLGEKQVLVKIHSVCITPIDIYLCKGTHCVTPTLPFTPGRDGAGIVAQVGDSTSRIKRGDRVYFTRSITGCYAQYALVNIKYVFPLSVKLSYSQGACLASTYFTAYRALILKGKAKAHEAVLVHGTSGGIGIASCQIARARYMNVYGIAKTTEGRALMKENGAQMVLSDDDPRYPEKIMEITDNRGIDVALESHAESSIEDDIPLLKTYGRCVLIGSRGDIYIDPRDLITKEISLVGVNRANTTEADWKESERAIQTGIEEGWLRPPISHTFAIEDAPKAHTLAQVSEALVTLTVCREDEPLENISPGYHGNINPAFNPEITTQKSREEVVLP